MVSLVFIFSVSQILFVQVHGITLPFTSLAYKSLPSNPQCQLPSPTNDKRFIPPSNTTGEKNVDNIETSFLQESVKESSLKLVNHEPSTKCKENAKSSTSSLLDINNSNQTNETPMAINNIISSYSKCPPSTTTAKRENLPIPNTSALKNADSASGPKFTLRSVQEFPQKLNNNIPIMGSKENSMTSISAHSTETNLYRNDVRKNKDAELNNISSYSKAPPLIATSKWENYYQPITSINKKADFTSEQQITPQSVQESPRKANSKAPVTPQSANTDINITYQRKDKCAELKNISSYSKFSPSTSTVKNEKTLPTTSDVKNVEFVTSPQLSQQNMQESPMFVINSLVTELTENSMASTLPQLDVNNSYERKGMSFPYTKTEHLIPTTNTVKSVDHVSGPPFLNQNIQKSTLDPVNYASETTTKENSERSTLPQVDLTTKSKTVGTSININNLINANTAGIPDISILPPINLSYLGKNLQTEYVNKNYCFSNYPPIPVTPTNFISSKDIKSVNLKSSPPIVVKAVPYDTNLLNDYNLPPIFIDCSKQTSVPPNLNVNAFQMDPKFIPANLITQSAALGNSLCKAKEEAVSHKAPFVSNDCVIVPRSKEILNDDRKSLNIGQSLNNQKPVIVNKVFDPNISELTYGNDILFNSVNNLKNSNEAKYKIKGHSEIPSNNDMSLFISTTIPNSMKPCEYQSLNTNINSKTIMNNLNVQTPSTSYAYIPKEIPILSQLPNVLSNPEFTSSALKDISKPLLTVSNPYDTMSRTHTYIFEPMPQPETSKNILVPMVNSQYYFNSPTLSLTVPKSLDYIPSPPIYSNSQSNMNQVPNILQLPNVYTKYELLSPQPGLQCSPSSPQNTVIIKDLTSDNLLRSEIVTKPPSELQYTVQILPSAKETINAPDLNTGSFVMPTYPSNYLCSNSVPPSDSFRSAYNDKPVLSQNVSPKSISHLPHVNVPYTDSKEFTILPDASYFSNSLNNLISTLTSSLLSAFYDLSVKSQKEIECNIPTLQDTIIDLPSLIYSESSAPLSMPVFTLNPPMLSSPISLPTPKVKSPSKRMGKKSSGKRKVSSSKLPKTYISSVLINILPPQELPNDIIVIV